MIERTGFLCFSDSMQAGFCHANIIRSKEEHIVKKYVFLCVVFILGCSGAASGGDSGGATSFLNREPTAEELVDALKMPTPQVRYRSITVVQEEPRPKALLKIPFEFNSAELTREAKETLDRVGQALTSDELAADTFQLVGHTDGKGEADYNLQLSARRALAVKNYLEKFRGVDSRRLAPIGKGEGELLDREHPFSGENRRVEIINVGEQ